MSGFMKEIAGPFELRFIHNERSAIDLDSGRYRWARDNVTVSLIANPNGSGYENAYILYLVFLKAAY